MCHTLLQHYIYCAHTDVTYISCDDISWYPQHRDDGLGMEWRDHTQLCGVAHSYRRKCLACLKRKWLASSEVRDRAAIDGWQRFATERVDEDDGNSDVTTTEVNASASTNGASSDMDDISADSRASTLPVIREPPTDASSSGAINEESPGSSPLRSETQLLPFDIYNDRLHQRNSDKLQACLDHCESRIEDAIDLYPGLEAWSLGAIDELLTGLSSQLVLPGFTIRIPSHVASLISGEIRSFSVESVFRVVVDNENSGFQIRKAIGTLIVRLLLTRGRTQAEHTDRPGSAEDNQSSNLNAQDIAQTNVLRVVEWFLLLLSLHNLSYDEHKHARGSDPAGVEVDPISIMDSAWYRYMDFLQNGPTAAVRNALALEVPFMAVIDGIENDLNMNEQSTEYGVSYFVNDTTSSRENNNNHTLESRIDLRDADNDNTMTPRLTIISMPFVTASDVDGNEENDNVPRKPSSSHPTASCNDPTHTCQIVHQTRLSELLLSKQHGICPRPLANENVNMVATVHEVLFRFAGCGHYNAVLVEKLSMRPSDKLVASCGCDDFAAGLLLDQRAFSRDVCLLCRSNVVFGLSPGVAGESAVNYERACFDRYVRRLEAGRVVGMWPFGARST